MFILPYIMQKEEVSDFSKTAIDVTENLGGLFERCYYMSIVKKFSEIG